jgi:antitoxin component of MazEF toxin-antitoxin module
LKPLHLNLASQPYRDYRQVYAVVVVMSLLIALLMLNNIDTYYKYKTETKTTRSTTAKLEAEAEQEKARANAADAQLRSFDLNALGNETKFINARLAERAFSWSELLDRLEDILPRDVRIINVTPSFQRNGLVHLEMLCDSKTPEGMLQTITNLQKNRQFANPFPHNETAIEKGGYSFTIGADFKPSIARPVEKK